MTLALQSRLSWAFAAAGALAGTAIARANAGGLFDPAAPVVRACIALALLTGLGAAVPERTRIALAPLVAGLRLAVLLLALGVWRGEARELWCAAAVWVAWRDADAGLSGERPFVPAALGLLVAFAWNGSHPGPAASRAVPIALIAGFAASRADAARRARGDGASPELRARDGRAK